MATDPLVYFESHLEEEFEGAKLWTDEEKMDAISAYDMADYILESMLTYDQDVADYFSALPSWFKFESIFTGFVSVRDISAWAVSEYCRDESEVLSELAENGF